MKLTTKERINLFYWIVAGLALISAMGYVECYKGVCG